MIFQLFYFFNNNQIEALYFGVLWDPNWTGEQKEDKYMSHTLRGPFMGQTGSLLSVAAQRSPE